MHNSSMQHIVVTVAPPSNGRRENYSRKQAKTLGQVQVILGITCFVCQLAAMVNRDLFLAISSAGLWGGVMIVIAGGLGICAAKKKTTCLIVAVMVMSIFAAFSSFIIIVFSALSLGSRDTSWEHHDDPDFTETRKDCIIRRCPVYTTQPCTFTRDTRCEVRVAMGIILLLCGVAEFVFAIWASSLCCAATCCGPTPQARTQGVVYHGPASQLCQITSTGGQMTIPSTAIGNIQYVTPGQVVLQPAPIGNAALPSYAQATAQPEAVLNCALPAVYNQPAPTYSHDAGQPALAATQPQSTECSKTSAEAI